MSIDNITVRLTDGIKTGDYAPPKLYELTALISNPSDDDVKRAVDLIVREGERFLGRTAPAAVVEKPARKSAAKADPTAPPAETPPPADDPLAGAASPASEPGTEAGLPDTGGDISDLLDDAPAVEISNEELKDAVMKRSEALKDGVKIRALVETFNPSPGLRVFKATEIEQKDRAKFLKDLAAL